MTDYISWLKTNDAAFRADYFEKTGEKIQDDPIDAGTHWQVGSTRLTPDMITELKKTVSVKAEKIITSFKSAKALADKVATKTALKGV